MSRTALYRHYDAANRLLYVGVSQNPLRRSAEHNSKSAWYEQIARSSTEWHENRELALEAEAAAISAEQPIRNISGSTAALLAHMSTLSKEPRGAGASLGEWLKRHGIKQTDAAKTLNQSRSYICEICNGVKSPSLRLAVLIEDFTGGEITVRDLADFYDAAQQVPA